MVHRAVFDGIKSVAKQVGYVYLFRYQNFATGEDLIKIGTSEAPRRRFAEVAASLPGKLTYQGSFAVWEPLNTEQALHKQYRHCNQCPYYAGPNAGKDEFFALTATEWVRVFSFLLLKNALAALFFLMPIITVILLAIGPVRLARFAEFVSNPALAGTN